MSEILYIIYLYLACHNLYWRWLSSVSDHLGFPHIHFDSHRVLQFQLVYRSCHFITNNCTIIITKVYIARVSLYTGCFRRKSKYFRRWYYGLFQVNKFIQTRVQFSMGVKIQLFEVGAYRLDLCLWGWIKTEVYKGKVNTRDELVARIMNNAALINKNVKTTSGELHVLLPRGLKSAFKSMVEIWTLNLNCCNLLRSFT